MSETESKNHSRIGTRKQFLILFVILLCGMAAAHQWVGAPFEEIARLEKQYQQTRPGMTLQDVQEIMGEPTSIISENRQAWWDDEKLPAEATAKVSQEIRYSVSTFYLPVSFGFAFDDKGKLVGRHRYD